MACEIRRRSVIFVVFIVSPVGCAWRQMSVLETELNLLSLPIIVGPSFCWDSTLCRGGVA